MSDPGNKRLIQQKRNALLKLMHFEVSAPESNGIKSPTVATKQSSQRKDELDSYDALVREAGSLSIILP
jgi:hypothetical protein